jgi:hypothetical protein
MKGTALIALVMILALAVAQRPVEKTPGRLRRFWQEKAKPFLKAVIKDIAPAVKEAIMVRVNKFMDDPLFYLNPKGFKERAINAVRNIITEVKPAAKAAIMKRFEDYMNQKMAELKL